MNDQVSPAVAGLAEFLTARLGEDGATAKAAAEEGPWFWAQPLTYPQRIARPAEAAHIARHDPARVLREVAAKRAILARYVESRSWSYPPGDGDEVVREALEETVRVLAVVYSDHPDYEQEWK